MPGTQESPPRFLPDRTVAGDYAGLHISWNFLIEIRQNVLRSALVEEESHYLMDDPILEVRDLVKDYPGQRALAGISLSVPRGSFFSLLGPSGCGKTTTLRLIAGFEQATSGDVLLKGEVVNQRKPYERKVSTVFQNYALFPHLSARANIEFGLKRQGATDFQSRVEDVLELVGLAGKEARKPAQLSGGERQRVALARSLVLEPDVLLLDEPLAALDPKLRKQMRVELKAMQRRAGITFLLVTHDQEEALSMSDQLAVMNEGHIEQMGTPEEVYFQPAHTIRGGLPGRGELDWQRGRSSGGDSHCAQPGKPWRPLHPGAGDRLSIFGRLFSSPGTAGERRRSSGAGAPHPGQLPARRRRPHLLESRR